ncbi:hypothetical protein AV530_004518 [Patagioenas fasciata monilis]|uniref:Uncharacterized protein n=1 Tax=Patagioenas fasciata monilis TaxID=372326 RepID=A0A1V4J5H6_PATFA|nr:hypothetical protein AV530_004518 [Patagioenas fasciata monilis]
MKTASVSVPAGQWIHHILYTPAIKKDITQEKLETQVKSVNSLGRMGNKQEELEVCVPLQVCSLTEITEAQWKISRLECCNGWVQAIVKDKLELQEEAVVLDVGEQQEYTEFCLRWVVS